MRNLFFALIGVALLVAAPRVLAQSAGLPIAVPIGNPGPTPTPAPTPTLPPQGVYNNCDAFDLGVPFCEAEDLAITGNGFVLEIDYNGLLIHSQANLKTRYTYDAALSPALTQVISVKAATTDASDALTGNSLVTAFSALAGDCSATTNAQFITCIHNVATSVGGGFNWEWYIYDEPGCNGTSYCEGSQFGFNYNFIAELAGYIRSIDPTHAIVGTQVGDIGASQQDQTNKMFCWLISTVPSACPTSAPITGQTSPMPSPPALAPVAGFDRYPVPQGTGAPDRGQIGDVGTIATALGTTIPLYNSAATTYYVGQAFSWFQADGGSAPCTTITICPFPTTAEMQAMRDNALFYGKLSGAPMQAIFWYYWPYVTCIATYTGCNSATNQASLQSAAFAPWPTATPTAVP